MNFEQVAVASVAYLIKEPLSKIIGKPAEEIGDMLAEKLRYYRFKQSVKIMIEADEYMKKHSITSQGIALKNLVPLLEGAAIEEDDSIQTMYRNLLINYLDPAKNLKTNVYPHLLSQISSEELQVMIDLSCYNYEPSEASSLSFGYFFGNVTEISTINKATFTEKYGEDFEQYIYNLIRLGLIVEEYDLEKEQGQYFVGSMGEQIGLKNAWWNVNEDKLKLKATKHLELTSLGRGLISACTIQE